MSHEDLQQTPSRGELLIPWNLTCQERLVCQPSKESESTEGQTFINRSMRSLFVLTTLWVCIYATVYNISPGNEGSLISDHN